MPDISVFNRRHIRQQRLRSLSSIAKHGFLFEWSAEQIFDRISDIKKTFPLAIGIGNRVPKGFWQNLKQAKEIENLFRAPFKQESVFRD